MTKLTPEEIKQEILNTLAMVENELCFGGNWVDAKARISRCRVQLAKSHRDRPCSRCKGTGLIYEHYAQEKHEHTGRKISCYICQGTGKANSPDREKIEFQVAMAMNTALEIEKASPVMLKPAEWQDRIHKARKDITNQIIALFNEEKK